MDFYSVDGSVKVTIPDQVRICDHRNILSDQGHDWQIFVCADCHQDFTLAQVKALIFLHTKQPTVGNRTPIP